MIENRFIKTIMVFIVMIISVVFHDASYAKKMPRYYEEASQSDKTFSTIAMEFAKEGKFDKAIKAARSIASHKLRGVTLGAIAAECGKAKKDGRGCECDPPKLMNEAMGEFHKGGVSKPEDLE